jgi:hypothetical protein
MRRRIDSAEKNSSKPLFLIFFSVTYETQAEGGHGSGVPKERKFEPTFRNP